MLKYLIIQLDDISTSLCHYPNHKTESHLIPLEILKAGIFWSMKENLTLQFIYPDHELPAEYKAEIIKTYHADIVSSRCEDHILRQNAEVVVFNSWKDTKDYLYNQEQVYVFRTDFDSLLDNSKLLYTILPKTNRINIVITDILSFSEKEKKYAEFLESLSHKIIDEYMVDHSVQVNLLTDRIFLDGMNNCCVGDETVTLCTDGRFYICPAFYFDQETSYSIGNITDGLEIKNPHLFKISYAPICRKCDAYQCYRCIWLNKKSTNEVNTPSHEQCVISHIERNTSKKLLDSIRQIGEFRPEKVIKEIDYLDPFDILQQ